ncbi:phosphatidylinositol-4-phosphate 5-kinase its3 [Metarhizium guizhouense ARSEF 977]|uniref:1-phosphatidylinositol-4-phosphate 5-kinase n=1 Tax=Metarhizium guizhouense (strain ARSEF 977) TaxID=1276136 RepID=A0A0B4IBR8_METGA|nr:phosphatidylinositol-4-phosphate 5-kinase its3 [Metarhizium guizhouense ARSEF 977]
MPSFLNDDNSPIFSAEADLLNLDPNNQFGLEIDKKKANGVSIAHTQPEPINESFDESSTTSTHDSETSDTNHLPMNGNSTRPTSMSSLANGINGSSANDAYENSTIKALPNGTLALPDRTAPKPPASGVNGNSASETTSSYVHQNSTPLGSPVVAHQHQFHDHKPAPWANGATLTQGSAQASTPESDLNDNDGQTSPVATQVLPVSELVPQKSSPHRFSSPPAYQSGGSALTTSPSGHLQPPHAGSLKQRHTLEISKPPPGRGSKDGPDVAQASGRFSPTVAPIGHRRASLNLARRTTRSMQSDAPRDEILPDEDAIRWAEAYRQKRASKRKRKEEEDDDRVLVGTKVDESHANWVTAYNMLTGIRVSVSRTNAKLDRELTDADFEAKQKSTFDITGNELVPSAKYDFKFKDYAPWVFRHLRALFRLDPADYLMSLTGKYILSELGSPGKSGSFFYFSRDYKYIIKTIHHSEHKFLRKILRDYFNHIQNNPNTLLSQFYGLHRVKMPYGKKIHFVVMNNLFPPHRDIHTTFDLKGSTIGRDYREDDLEKNPRATLKDLNWLRRQQHLELGIKKKRLFLEQLQKDVVLLKRLQIMDYSLLIGIHDISRGNEENLRDKTLQVFNPGGEKTTDDDPPSVLMRTPSKMENVRKARELREKIRAERPIPIGQALDKMPDELRDFHTRPGFVFNQDDGGFRATHENNQPADEIYYLGVIDCLTHYGMIKKIEHFWKGLSHDRSQISALPPEQYGDRFYNFVEGITMSAEEARREALRREQEANEGRVSADKSAKRHSAQRYSHGVPPMPDHLPPAPPTSGSSAEVRETMQKASKEAKRTESSGVLETDIPDRVLTTASSPDKRESFPHEPILPVVEEAAEGSRNDGGSVWDRPKNLRNGNTIPPPPTGPPPPTPPKERPPPPPLKSDGHEPDGQVLRPRLSKESLNKNLPPLPKDEETQDTGVRMV